MADCLSLAQLLPSFDFSLKAPDHQTQITGDFMKEVVLDCIKGGTKKRQFANGIQQVVASPFGNATYVLLPKFLIIQVQIASRANPDRPGRQQYVIRLRAQTQNSDPRPGGRRTCFEGVDGRGFFHG